MGPGVWRSKMLTSKANMKNLINSFLIISLMLVLSASISYSQKRQADSTSGRLQKSLIAATDEHTGNTQRRLSLSYYLAHTSSGPASDIEIEMNSSGWDETSPGFFGPGVKHPFSNTGFGALGFPWMLGLDYRIKAPFSLAVFFGNLNIGTTLGYHENGSFLFINYSVSMVASTFSVQSEGMRLGVGPAIFTTNVWRTDEPGELVKKDNKIGFLIDFGLAIPANYHLFAELKVQYRKVGRVEIGPFMDTGKILTATLPATKVSYDHWFMGLGLGIRH